MIIQKQQEAIQAIKDGKNVAIIGAGGVGKSYVIQQVTDEHTVLCAPTGIAAINIKGATCHSVFGLPITYPTDADYNKISPNLKQMFSTYSNVKRIIIDEVSMLAPHMLDLINHKLQKVRNNKRPFGGLQMVVVGDFYQLESIVKKEELPLLLEKYKTTFAFSAESWNFTPIVLTEVVRQSDAHQISLLDAIRRKTPDYIKALQEIQHNAKPYVNNADTLHLCCYNADADNINDYWFKQVSSKKHMYYGKGDIKEIPIPKVLELKVGCKVLLCANDLEGAYVNGDRGVVLECYNTEILVRKDNGEEVLVTPFTWEKYKLKSTSKGLSKSLEATFTQLPIRLGWAVSVHKSQSMTLDNVAIHTGRGCFSHGQAYTALSRIRDLNNISFVSPMTQRDIIVKPEVQEFMNSLG